jgi:hypothetical protein
VLAGFSTLDNFEAPGVPEACPYYVSNLSVHGGSDPYRVRIFGGQGTLLYIDSPVQVAANTAATRSVDGNILIQTRQSDADATAAVHLQFTVLIDTTVYVGYDTAGALPSWLSGWTDTLLDIPTTAGLYRLYSKSFSAGSAVTLPGNRNGGGTGVGNYMVLVEPTGTPLVQGERTIFYPSEAYLSTVVPRSPTVGSYPLVLPSGTYDVTAASYDNHSEGGSDSASERWSAALDTETIPLGTIGDIPAGEDWRVETIATGVALSSASTDILMREAGDGGSVGNYCVAFERTGGALPTPSISGTKLCPGPAGIRLSWLSIAGVTDYEVHRCAGVGCDPSVSAPTSIPAPALPLVTYDDTSGLSVGTTYRYQVRAIDTSTSDTSALSNTITVPYSICVAPLSVDIDAIPARVLAGGQTMLSWSSSNADSCTISSVGGDVFSSTALQSSAHVPSSSLTRTITANTTYTISCSRVAPPASQSKSKTVSVAVITIDEI